MPLIKIPSFPAPGVSKGLSRSDPEKTVEYKAELRKKALPFIKFDIVRNPPARVTYETAVIEHPAIHVDIPLEFLPPNPERIKKQEEAKAKAEETEKAVQAAESSVRNAEQKAAAAESALTSSFSSATVESDAKAKAIAQEALEAIANARTQLSQAIKAKDAAAQASSASGYVEAAKYEKAAKNSAARVDGLTSRANAAESRAKAVKTEVEKREARREAVDLVEKIRQLMIAAQAAANLAERKMQEANEAVEVEVITADSQSAVEAWRTADSKTQEAERMMEKVRNASKRAGEKGAEDAVNQAQQLLSQARAALELANEAKEDAEQLLKSVNKKCAACCVVM